PWGTRATGHEEVRRALATRFAGIPDVHYGSDRHLVCGDRGVSEWTLTGTLNGKPVEIWGCDLFEFSAGKISRKNSYWKITEEVIQKKGPLPQALSHWQSRVAEIGFEPTTFGS